jgi:hypothetical protein
MYFKFDAKRMPLNDPAELRSASQIGNQKKMDMQVA